MGRPSRKQEQTKQSLKKKIVRRVKKASSATKRFVTKTKRRRILFRAAIGGAIGYAITKGFVHYQTRYIKAVNTIHKTIFAYLNNVNVDIELDGKPRPQFSSNFRYRNKKDYCFVFFTKTFAFATLTNELGSVDFSKTKPLSEENILRDLKAFLKANTPLKNIYTGYLELFGNDLHKKKYFLVQMPSSPIEMKDLKLNKKLTEVGNMSSVCKATYQRKQVVVKYFKNRLDYLLEVTYYYKIRQKGSQIRTPIRTPIYHGEVGGNRMGIVLEYIDAPSVTDTLLSLVRDQTRFNAMVTKFQEKMTEFKTSLNSIGIYYIDWSPNNMLYNSKKDEFILIDGGLSRVLKEGDYSIKAEIGELDEEKGDDSIKAKMVELDNNIFNMIQTEMELMLERLERPTSNKESKLFPDLADNRLILLNMRGY